MQVQHILRTKSNTGIFFVPPQATLAEVSEILSARKIGAVIVSSDGRQPMGIISERDVVRELGRRGADCLTDSAEKVMTRDPVTCVPQNTALEVLAMMDKGNFRHMPVMGEAGLEGVISIRDVVRARLQELDMEKEALTGMIMGN